MAVTMGQVMAEVRNYFPKLRMKEEWTIRGGVLSPNDMLLTGDLIAIGGSLRNDGVYEVQEGGRLEGVQDEVFQGSVWLLCPPPAFMALCEEISAWEETKPAYGVKKESFGCYSRENAVSAEGVSMGWQDVFKADLLPYRRMFSGVRLG